MRPKITNSLRNKSDYFVQFSNILHVKIDMHCAQCLASKTSVRRRWLWAALDVWLAEFSKLISQCYSVFMHVSFLCNEWLYCIANKCARFKSIWMFYLHYSIYGVTLTCLCLLTLNTKINKDKQTSCNLLSRITGLITFDIAHFVPTFIHDIVNATSCLTRREV